MDLEQCKADADAIIAAADKALKNDAALIALQSDQIEGLRFQYNAVKTQLDEQAAWYKKPEIVIPLSFVAGAAAMAWAGRR